MVSLYQLECFVSLASSLNFTKAAMSMYITQPAFSRHISNLEKELGIVLFYRDKRSVELTAAGKSFLEEAKKIITQYNNGIIKAKQAEKGMIGSLKIGFLREKVNELFPKIITNFRHKYPNIDLVMNQYNHSKITMALQNNAIDVAFTTSLDLSFISDIKWKTISEQYLSVVMHRDHPLSGNNSIDIVDLAKEPFVLLDPKESFQGYNNVVQICREHGFNPIVAAQAYYVSGLLTLIECKVGISILPISCQNMASPSICFKKIRNNSYKIEGVVAWKKNNLNPCLWYFCEEMKKLIPLQ